MNKLIRKINRETFVAVLFALFVILVPVVTVIRGFLPQDEISTEQEEAVLDGNGSMQNGSKGDTTTQTQEETGIPAETVKEPWFTTLQNDINHFTDNLFLRNKLIAFNTKLTSTLTDDSYIESTQVLLGKNNWLFYKTEIDGHPIWDYMGVNHFTEEELSAIADNLTGMRNYFENELGIDFIVMGVPNKEIVYAENMPDTVYRIREDSRADQLAEYLWANTDLTYIFPKQALLHAKQKYQVYYTTDTHWNQIGAFVGLQDMFQQVYGKSAEPDTVKFEVTAEDYAGDLATIAGLTDKYNIDTTYVFQKESADLSQYRDEVALVVGDSFSGFLSVVADPYYKEVIWEYTANFKMSMIDEYQPDVIIWESTERYLETFRDVNLLVKQ